MPRPLLLGLLALAVFLLGQSRPLRQIELWTYDQRLVHFPPPRAGKPEVLFVRIDSESLVKPPLEGRHSVFWPGPLAQVMRRLNAAGATVIGLDFSYQASIDRYLASRWQKLEDEDDQLDFMETGPAGDLDFQNACRECRVVMMAVLDPTTGELTTAHPDLAAFAEDARAAANLSPDLDGVIRHGLLSVKGREESYLTLPTALLARHLEVPVNQLRFEANELVAGERRIPIPADRRVEIAYLGPPGTLPHLAIHEIHSLSHAELQARVKGKAVLIAPAYPQSEDTFSTPVAGKMYGGEIHLSVLQTLLENRPVRAVPPLAIRAALLILAAFLALRAAPVKGGLILLGALVLYTVGAVALFRSHGLWLPLADGLLALALYLLFSLVRYLAERAERLRLQQLFARYVSAPVAAALLRNPALLALGGTRREVSILMSDINDFTTTSESNPPEQIIEALNEYFARMERLIHQEEGTLKQFVGDEIMVMWGAPQDQPDHAVRAVRTAWRMQQDLEAWSQERVAAGQLGWGAKIGLHTGSVVAGNVGSQNRTEYAAVGDVVNTTARIEGLNKKLGTTILMSQAIYAQVAELVEARPAGKMPVKGKATEVEVYELLGWKGELP